jgi:hypothetical protein
MTYILFLGIVIIAAIITKYTVPFILSTAKIPHHLVPIINFLLNIAVLLSTFFVLYFSFHVFGIINTTHQRNLVDEKESRISKEEDHLAEEKEHERIKQERLKDLEAEQERQQELKAEQERQHIEFEKQQRLLAEEKERQQREQERLQELKAEQERQRIEFEKQQRLLAEEKERQQGEQERLQELKAEKEHQRIEFEKQQRLLAEEKEHQQREQERLQELKAEKKSPCEKIQDSLDKSLLDYAIRKPGNEMTILRNKQGVDCYIIPTGIRGRCIEYQIQKEGSSALCFYKECTGR